MRIAAILLTALTCPSFCIAQSERDAAAIPDRSFRELDAEFTRVWRAWRTKNSAARRSGASATEQSALQAAEPTTRYIGKFQQGASRHRGTDRAIDYLQWILSWSWRHDRNAATAALDQLLRDHVDHPGMVRVAFSLALKARRAGFPRQKVLDAQELIANRAASPQAKADALYWRCYVIAGTDSKAAEKERALRDLATAIDSATPRIKQQARGLRFELTRLQIGMPAPEIEGEDLDGVTFKLSDYRGKVVLLDFWGDW